MRERSSLSMPGNADKWYRFMAALCIAGTVGACSTDTLARLPRSGTNLGGHWVRDAAASDDGEQIIARALPPPPRRHPDSEDGKDVFPAGPTDGGRRSAGRIWHRSEPAQAGDGDEAGPETTPPQVWSWHGTRDMVRAFALPPTQLTLLQEPSRIVIEQPERRRTFEPGSEVPLSLTDRFGSRSVRAGWSEEVLVIETGDKGRLSVMERYRRLGDNRLESTITFHAAHLKSVEIRTVYRRATGAELAGFCRTADDARTTDATDPLSRRPCPE